MFSESEVEKLVDLNSLKPKSGLCSREMFRTGPSLNKLYDSQQQGGKNKTPRITYDRLASQIHLIDRQSKTKWKVCMVDQIHFYHSGSGMFIEMIDANGMLFEDIRLGLGTNEGHVGSPQVMVPSGWFYRYRLAKDDPFCLFGCVCAANDTDSPLNQLVSTSHLMNRCSKTGFDMMKTLIINCYDWTPDFRDSEIVHRANNPVKGKRTANSRSKMNRLRSVYGSLSDRIAMWTESFSSIPSNISLTISSGNNNNNGGDDIPCVD